MKPTIIIAAALALAGCNEPKKEWGPPVFDRSLCDERITVCTFEPIDNGVRFLPIDYYRQRAKEPKK